MGAKVTKARRDRIDGTAGAVQVMAKAAAELRPPAHVTLRDIDEPFFANVIAEFAKSEWSQHQLELAAMLARKMADLDELQRTIAIEGYVLATGNGTPMANPRLQGIRALDASIMATRRTLALHARAQGGEARDTAKRRELAKGIEANNPLDDELLARPN